MGGGAPARRLLDARRAGPLSAPRAALVLLLGASACAAFHPAPRVPLRVGTPGDYAPFSRLRDGAYEGLDVDVARRFAADTGRALELVPFRWPDLVHDLDAGRFDLAMGGITMRPERAVAGAFTRPVVEAGAVVLVRPWFARTKEEVDRPGVRLAVNAGGHLERVARRLFPHTLITPVADNRALPEVVAAGSAEAIMTDDVEAVLLAAVLPDVRRIGPLTRDRKAYLGRDPGLVAELDAWLRAREADGTLATLRTRWLAPERAARRTAFESDLDALLALIDLRLAFMPAVAAAKEARGLRIHDPAREARVIEAARSAAAGRGVDPDGVERLFRAQIVAALEVERAFLAMPRDRREPVETLDLERQARPALGRVSTVIVERAADLAAHPELLAAQDAARLAGRLDPLRASDAARLEVARAVVALARQ